MLLMLQGFIGRTTEGIPGIGKRNSFHFLNNSLVLVVGKPQIFFPNCYISLVIVTTRKL